MSYKVVESVFDNGPANRTEKLLLLAIAENASDVGYAFPGVALMARRTDMCERHVIRLLRKMAVDGWLVILPRAEGFGKKQTAYQINLTKLASNASHAAQIAAKKDKSARRKELGHDSHATPISPDASDDIVPHSQATFEPVSSDISPLPILKNHEPSLEPTRGIDGSKHEFVFGVNNSRRTAPLSTPSLTKPRPMMSTVQRARMQRERR